MRIKLLIAALLFCVIGHAQTIKVWERPEAPRDTVHHHWHSYTQNKDLNENVKDSAYKYWKLQVVYEDSARQAKASNSPAWLEKYYQNQVGRYTRKSIHYKDLQ